MPKLKTLIVTILLLSLTGCSWIPFLGKKNTAAPTDFTIYNGQEFTLSYPKDWEVVTTFGSKYDKDTKPLIGFREKDSVSDFKANLNLIKTTLNNKISSSEFGLKKIDQHKQALSDYQELDQEKIELATSKDKKDETILVLFTGKYEPNGQAYKFMQTFLVQDKTAYTVTAAILPAENDEALVKKMQTMLQSFALK